MSFSNARLSTTSQGSQGFLSLQYQLKIQSLIYWKKSSIRHDHWLTPELDPSNWRLFTLPLSLEYTVPTVPTVGTIPKIVLRKEGVVEIIWVMYMTEPRLGLCIDSGMWVCDLFVFWLPKTSLVCKFSCLLKLPPTSFFCLSAPSVYGDKFVNQHHHLNLNIILSSAWSQKSHHLTPVNQVRMRFLAVIH